jgi:hypothetical protein
VTAPIPEEEEQRPLGEVTPPGEHGDELPGPEDAAGGSDTQAANAGTSQDEPSDGSGGE